MYPKICTHRNDPLSQVVVANEDQYLSLPEEYRNSDFDYQSDAEDDSLDPDVLSEMHDKLHADRAQLVKDQKAFSDDLEKAKADFRAERAALDAERAQFELEKAEFNAAQDDKEDIPGQVSRPRGRPRKDAVQIDSI